MSKHPNRKPISRRDIVRAVEGLIRHVQIVSQRMDGVERILSDYIEHRKQENKFGKFLDGKYKQEPDIGSGTDPSPSKE